MHEVIETQRPAEPPLLAATIDKSTEISGLSRSAIYRAARKGQITIRKNGSRSLILVSELQAFLQGLPASAGEA